MQPSYMPWVGYFDLIDQVDQFVFYDDVQLAKRSWQVRNRIKSASGELWLTIPIKRTKPRAETLILEAEINFLERWVDKHVKSIETNYRKSVHFEEVFGFLQGLYKDSKTLSNFNIDIISNISTKLGINTAFYRSSELKKIKGAKDERLSSICQSIGSENYLSPKGSAIYINEFKQGGVFMENSIKLLYHDYDHPEYHQLYGTFIPFMGIYDLLFNQGFDKSLAVIRSGRKKNIPFSDL